jgi:hypothetical protein
MVSRELGAIAVLAADLERAHHGLDEAYRSVDAELRSACGFPDDPKTLAYLAVSLSQYYNALEDLLGRAAGVFEGSSSGEAWHAELLRRATLDLAGLRPALVSQGALRDATTLLKFRHFLRHAYAVKLDAAKLGTVTDALRRLHPALEESLADFRSFLQSLLAEPE